MPSHLSTTQYGASYVQAPPNTTCTNAVACGSGPNRTIIVRHFRRIGRAETILSVTLGGEAMTVLGSDLELQANYAVRAFALVNPTVEGTQDLVITATTNGSNSVGSTIVVVIENSDPAADEAALMTLDDSGTLTTPWTADVTAAIPSESGALVVAGCWGMSLDVAFDLDPTGMTEALWSGGGGIYDSCGYADGAATVNVSWTPGGVGQDMNWVTHGFSIPAPGGYEWFGVAGVQRRVTAA